MDAEVVGRELVVISLLAGGAWMTCGRSVVIEDGAAAAAASGGLGGTGGVPHGGSFGWAGAETGPCRSCAEWLEGCGGAGLCATPACACAGEPRQQLDALVQCICAGCVEACETCVMFHPYDEACRGCQLGALTAGCLYERASCTDERQ